MGQDNNKSKDTTAPEGAAVLTHERFKIDTDKLSEMGISVVATDLPSDSEAGLRAPAYGEDILGTLTNEEFAVYIELSKTKKDLEQVEKRTLANIFHSTGDMVNESESLQEMAQKMQEEGQTAFANDDDAKAFFALQGRAALLHSMFYYQMAAKYDCHEYRMGVRTERRFIKGEKKY